MKTIALTRLNILSMPKGSGFSPAKKIAFQAELAHLGYRISNAELLEKVSENFLLGYQPLIKALREKRGGKVKYVPLFTGFPNKVPDDEAYFAKRVLGYVGNLFGLFTKGKRLETGIVVPEWLFDLSDFGADPVTQMQTKSLFEAALKQGAKRSADKNTEWIDLEIVFDDDLSDHLEGYLQRLVYAKSSIKEALYPSLNDLLAHFGASSLDARGIVFKETQALVLKHFWEHADYAAVLRIARTPSDMLRMMAALTETDISLATKMKFPKMSRKQRKTVLEVLENSVELAEDLKMYKGLWLELGRYLHPFEYRKAFPKTAAGFDALRNGKIETFASRTEMMLADGVVNGEVQQLLPHLATKPGVFARKLHEVLRKLHFAEDQVLDAFEAVAQEIQLKNLLVMQSYFRTINRLNKRTVINKKGRILIMANSTKGALSDKALGRLDGILQYAIMGRLAQKGSWQNKAVWIDPGLSGYTVPLGQRKASDGMITVGRGTRIKADFSKVLRLFVYWKETRKTTDLDLSVVQFDAKFQYVGHVSYTNLAADGIVHSGDLQSAPHGAVEFMDITLNKLDPKVKYLAIQVYKYAGEDFDEMDCHAGWMLRNDVNADIATFDIKTVVNKFDLNGKSAYAIPLIVDLRARDIIMTDLYVGGCSFGNNVEGSAGNISEICEQISKFTWTRPVLSELAQSHVLARDAYQVPEKAHADITFGVKDCTYNGSDVAQILSEWI